MPKKYHVALDDAHRQLLEGRRGQAPTPRRRNRGETLPRADDGETDAEVAQALGTTPNTVARGRRRFVEEGLDAALAGRPPPRGPAQARRQAAGGHHRPGLQPHRPGPGPLIRPPPLAAGRRPGGRRVGLAWGGPPPLERSDPKPWRVRSRCLPQGLGGEFARRSRSCWFCRGSACRGGSPTPGRWPARWPPGRGDATACGRRSTGAPARPMPASSCRTRILSNRAKLPCRTTSGSLGLPVAITACLG